MKVRPVLIVALSVAVALALGACSSAPTPTAHPSVGATALPHGGTGSTSSRPSAGTAPTASQASPTSAASPTPAVTAAAPSSPASVTPATSTGPDGVTSGAVVAENRRPGASDWRIQKQGPGMIEGFADHDYARQGDAVGLFVSTDQSRFVATAYRMGWYGGAGARQIWQSGPITGTKQAQCGLDPSRNMVSCADWTRSTTMRVTAAFVPGDYLIKLTGARDAQSYILLTVWEPASRATYLVMNRSMVEQGWNTYGGFDFYEGQGPCILDTRGYPPCNRARAVSFDRPYAGDGTNDFLTSEYPMVEFAEQEGLDVTYCTDICVSDHPGFLLQHRALIGLDHDETWTDSERVGALDAAAAGVNMAFFGAATLVRHARLESSALGPGRVEVDYRDSGEDPLRNDGNPADVTGNQWTSPPMGWDPESFLGQVYSGYLLPGQPSAPLKVFDAHSWLFAGTGLTDGAEIPAVINSDIEHIAPSGPMPRNIQVLAHSPIPLSHTFTNQGTWDGFTYSDATYYTNPAGAGIFDSGDNVWVAMLQECGPGTPNCPARLMRALTGNVFLLFGRGPAGRTQPSRPNWQAVNPPGS